MVLSNAFKKDTAAERFLMDVDHYSIFRNMASNINSLSMHSSKYQSVLDLIMLLGQLDVVDILPDDDDVWLSTSTKIYARGRRY